MHYSRILICAALAVLVAETVASYISLPVVQWVIWFVAFVVVAAVARPWYDPEGARAAWRRIDHDRAFDEIAELRRVNAELARENARLREQLESAAQPTA